VSPAAVAGAEAWLSKVVSNLDTTLRSRPHKESLMAGAFSGGWITQSAPRGRVLGHPRRPVASTSVDPTVARPSYQRSVTLGRIQPNVHGNPSATKAGA
jgi:hypothetical protein